ncbi:MAG TPA: maleylpyruvate isomerase family mycothiol-dependent enzyme [Chloroflexota bacterium]|nr:maleylpyruvate isomerase family mycothiol-dependent enzyme [Chloroflexota bacterium]
MQTATMASIERKPARVGHDRAMALAREELNRFLALLDALDEAGWERPTRCSLWNVRQTVAHLAGTAAAYARFAEFRRQANGKLQRPYRERGLDKLAAQNQIAVDDRAAATPEELKAELRQLAPRAIAFRARLPAPVRSIHLPLGLAFPLGRTWVSLGYLTDVILTRDMWMHRLDIALATGKEMVLTPEHDGPITALVASDLARLLGPKLPGAVQFDLAGPAGGVFTVGRGEPAATVVLDACDFHLLASGFGSLEEVRPRIAISGDTPLAERALAGTWVPY